MSEKNLFLDVIVCRWVSEKIVCGWGEGEIQKYKNIQIQKYRVKKGNKIWKKWQSMVTCFAYIGKQTIRRWKNTVIHKYRNTEMKKVKYHLKEVTEHGDPLCLEIHKCPNIKKTQIQKWKKEKKKKIFMSLHFDLLTIGKERETDRDLDRKRHIGRKSQIDRKRSR